MQGNPDKEPAEPGPWEGGTLQGQVDVAGEQQEVGQWEEEHSALGGKIRHMMASSITIAS